MMQLDDEQQIIEQLKRQVGYSTIGDLLNNVGSSVMPTLVFKAGEF